MPRFSELFKKREKEPTGHTLMMDGHRVKILPEFIFGDTTEKNGASVIIYPQNKPAPPELVKKIIDILKRAGWDASEREGKYNGLYANTVFLKGIALDLKKIGNTLADSVSSEVQPLTSGDDIRTTKTIVSDVVHAAFAANPASGVTPKEQDALINAVIKDIETGGKSVAAHIRSGLAHIATENHRNRAIVTTIAVGLEKELGIKLGSNTGPGSPG